MTADDLFQPRDVDRSPQAWAARLASLAAAEQRRAEQPSAHPTLPSRQAPQPGDAPGEQVSESTRRFLRPLIGIDPASVRLHRDDAAQDLTAAHAADALTSGDDVALAADQPTAAPETTALLAHELTHVARTRQPDFVPPIARRARQPERRTPTSAAPAAAAAPDASHEPDADLPADEEALALRVESRVARLARRDAEGAAPVTPGEALASLDAPAVPAPLPRAPRAAPGTWGTLPAPWEPLPAWLATMQPDAPPSSAPAPISPVTAGAGAASAPSVQLAAHDRALDDAEGDVAAPVTVPTNLPAQPEPDLDALARQVYTILKRRLADERRRMG